MTARRAPETQFYHWVIDRDMLRLIIQRRRFSPYSLASAAHLDKRVIYRLLSGERTTATLPTAEAIAAALDIDVALIAEPAMRWTPTPAARALRSG